MDPWRVCRPVSSGRRFASLLMSEQDLDPHQSDKSDPDSHQRYDSDPGPNQMEKRDPDQHQGDADKILYRY
jgi:hypothetical protein